MTDGPSAFGAFASVDQMPDPAMLIRVMDETSEWEATRSLRRQADAWLGARDGSRILDVGCGPGTAAIAVAAEVGPKGQVNGLDASNVMVDEANRRALAAGVPATFNIGDAENLEFGDDSFDGCRSERTLQWLDHPERALAEMVRVTRPGAPIVVIDTDWGTFAPDHPDLQTTERVKTIMMTQRPGFLIGRRLPSMFRRAGLSDVEVVPGTHLATDWDPSSRPGPPGLPPMALLLAGITAAGSMSETDATAWLDQLEQTARDGHFFASLTMFAVTGRKPA